MMDEPLSSPLGKSPDALTIACYGVGNIGRAWAIAFARHGHVVRLFDRSPSNVENSLKSIEISARDLMNSGLIADSGTVLSNIVPVSRLDDALNAVDYVQESIAENRDDKRAAFSELAGLAAASAILASSSSTIPGSQFMNVENPGRCIVVHPVNPPHLIRAVEVVPSPWTSPHTIDRVSKLLISIGQRPIVLRKEIFGFVVNRLQFAVINEALHLLRDGICDPGAIDTAMRDGLGPRWALYGIFETSHLNALGGIREYYAKFPDILREILECLHQGPCIPDDALTDLIANSLESRLPASDVPRLQLLRDRQLMGLRKFLADWHPN